MSAEDHSLGDREDVQLTFIRVARDPAKLTSRPPGEPALHRFDDPLGEYLVRYGAEDLETAVLEVLATLRSKPAVDDVTASVTGADDGYGQDAGLGAGEEPPLGGLPPQPKVETVREVLQGLKVGKVCIRQSGAFADVSDWTMRSALGKDARVRAAIHEFDGLVGNPADRVSALDGALIRLAGKVGRRITQAVSRAVYEQVQYLGIVTNSRWDDRKRCWAVFGEVEATVEEIEPLDPNNEEHRTAVAKAAALHGFPLPAEWS